MIDLIDYIDIDIICCAHWAELNPLVYIDPYYLSSCYLCGVILLLNSDDLIELI